MCFLVQELWNNNGRSQGIILVIFFRVVSGNTNVTKQADNEAVIVVFLLFRLLAITSNTTTSMGTSSLFPLAVLQYLVSF